MNESYLQHVGNKENGKVSWREYFGPLEFAHSFLQSLRHLDKATALGLHDTYTETPKTQDMMLAIIILRMPHPSPLNVSHDSSELFYELVLYHIPILQI